MLIIYDENVITLEELAKKICAQFEACEEDGCPAAKFCSRGKKGTLVWLQEVLKE